MTLFAILSSVSVSYLLFIQPSLMRSFHLPDHPISACYVQRGSYKRGCTVHDALMQKRSIVQGLISLSSADSMRHPFISRLEHFQATSAWTRLETSSGSLSIVVRHRTSQFNLSLQSVVTAIKILPNRVVVMHWLKAMHTLNRLISVHA